MRDSNPRVAPIHILNLDERVLFDLLGFSLLLTVTQLQQNGTLQLLACTPPYCSPCPPFSPDFGPQLSCLLRCDLFFLLARCVAEETYVHLSKASMMEVDRCFGDSMWECRNLEREEQETHHGYPKDVADDCGLSCSLGNRSALPIEMCTCMPQIQDSRKCGLDYSGGSQRKMRVSRSFATILSPEESYISLVHRWKDQRERRSFTLMV